MLGHSLAVCESHSEMAWLVMVRLTNDREMLSTGTSLLWRTSEKDSEQLVVGPLLAFCWPRADISYYAPAISQRWPNHFVLLRNSKPNVKKKQILSIINAELNATKYNFDKDKQEIYLAKKISFNSAVHRM